MRLFLASQSNDLAKLETFSIKYNILISYEYFNFNCVPQLNNLIDKYFIFDSGAFSVWKSGKSINFDDYISNCDKLSKLLGDKLIAINLDVIPAEFGKKPTDKEIKYACEQSWKNYLRMKKELSCKIMPVFHQHDDFNYLHKYIDEKVFLLGISPANDMSTKQRKPWLNQCFSITKNIQRCHGLAVTSSELMSSYPFYSCDSATWSLLGGFGTVCKFNGLKLETIHYTSKKNVEKHNIAHIIDNRKTKDIKRTERDLLNIENYFKMGNYINQLWKARGVIWND